MDENIFGERLRSYRLAHDMSQEQLATKLGTSKQVISRYESGQRTPKISVLAEYAKTLDLDVHYFLSDSEDIPVARNIISMPKMKKIPLIGDIACGTPILAVQNIEDYIDLPEHVHADFALRCEGDSMINARIHDGDVVYIRQQPTVNNGEIAAVLIDNEATLKRVYISKDSIILQPENPLYNPMSFVGGQLENVRIIGKAMAFTSLIK